MFKFEYLKDTIAVFISNAISDHEMSFQIKHTIKRNFRLKLGNLKHIELQPNLPVWSYKKRNVLDKNSTQDKFKSHIQHERSWLGWIVIEQVNFTSNTTFCLYFLNKFFSHIFKASSEESCCVLRKTRQNIWGSICGRVFFRKLAGWHLATSLWINLFTYNFQGF